MSSLFLSSQEIKELEDKHNAERLLHLQQARDAVDDEFDRKRESLHQRYDEEERQLRLRYSDDPEMLQDKLVALANAKAAELSQLDRDYQVRS